MNKKALAVLFALPLIGVKGIRHGLTFPVFLPHNIANVLVEKIAIKPIGTVEEDSEAMMAAKYFLEYVVKRCIFLL